ncbi:hypothetical protein B5F10_15585 [Anaerotruncus colihominis]|uniref:Uncharacterized protein n=1 Tax=Anaerotruncus colihominis TaxID=169435 RepID=A0A1Y4MGM2_9FIRM|nr:hypothetical protein B5F11_15760 [Anaerotruncus colihominis]OUP72200.1 hypothetical protein B5F10_15585 [Anaerotruncus colihominis]
MPPRRLLSNIPADFNRASVFSTEASLFPAFSRFFEKSLAKNFSRLRREQWDGRIAIKSFRPPFGEGGG